MKRLIVLLLLSFQITIFPKWYDPFDHSHDIFLELKATPQEVLLRFYLLKRLEGPIQFFKRCFKNNLLKVTFDYQEELNHVVISGVHFKQKDIVKVIKEIKKSGTFESLLPLWDALNSYKLLDDPFIVKEFSILTASILHANALNFGLELHEPLKHIKMPGSLASLPLEDILDILDLLIEELPDFFDKYEFDSDMSWQVWRRKYGIVSLIGGVALLIRIYLAYKKEHSRNDISAIRSIGLF